MDMVWGRLGEGFSGSGNKMILPGVKGRFFVKLQVFYS